MGGESRQVGLVDGEDGEVQPMMGEQNAALDELIVEL